MSTPPGSSKANTARRLVEILQLLDDLGRPATATEICDRGGWPSSSTRELLAMMDECGLLASVLTMKFLRPWSLMYRSATQVIP